MLFASSYVVGPLIAFAVVAILAALLRWTFASDVISKIHKDSHVAAKQGADYGLLRVVGVAANMVEAQALKARLADAGIRATFATTPAGHVTVLVFESQLPAARQVVGGSTR